MSQLIEKMLSIFYLSKELQNSDLTILQFFVNNFLDG